MGTRHPITHLFAGGCCCRVGGSLVPSVRAAVGTALLVRRGSLLVLFHIVLVRVGLAYLICCFIIIIIFTASRCIPYRSVLLCILSLHFCYFIPRLATPPPHPNPTPHRPGHPRQRGPAPVQRCAANKGASAAPHPLPSSPPPSLPTPPPSQKKRNWEKKTNHECMVAALTCAPAPQPTWCRR